jgi:hypothetical protein
MRSWLLVLALAAGCTFAVHGLEEASGPVVVPGGDQPLPEGGGDAPPDLAQAPADLALTPAPDMSQPPPLPPDMTPAQPRAIGDPCTSDAQCGSKRVCLDHVGFGPARIDFPSGYCSKSCDSDNQCPGDSSCQRLLLGVYYCTAECPPAQCRQSYRCCPSNNQCNPLSMCPN